MVAIAIAAPWIAPFDPNDQDVLLKLEPPSAAHWFGTDAFGRDVLSRVIYGARISLFVGAFATLAGVVIGTVIGVVSGYFGGVVDRLITAATDVLLSFPQLIMGLMLVAVLGANLFNLILAIAITAVPAFIRVARASTLAMKERDFVDACRALGFGDPRIMFLHVLPNIMDEVVVMGVALVRGGDPHRVDARLHRPGRAAADRDLGRHHPRRLRQPARRFVAVDLPEPGDPDDHDRAQPDRRRPARRQRPEGAAMSVAAAARRARTASPGSGEAVAHRRAADDVDPHRPAAGSTRSATSASRCIRARRSPSSASRVAARA